jgi:hypothetical protein
MEFPQPLAGQDFATPPRLYDLRAIDIATVLSSLFAGAFLISRNFTALGDDGAARKALVIGFAGLLPLSFLLVLAPQSPHYDGLMRLAKMSALRRADWRSHRPELAASCRPRALVLARPRQ